MFSAAGVEAIQPSPVFSGDKEITGGKPGLSSARGGPPRPSPPPQPAARLRKVAAIARDRIGRRDGFMGFLGDSRVGAAGARISFAKDSSQIGTLTSR
jgi:hypothetical protein